MIHRTLERLDSAASTIVPLAYLAGLMLGTMAYFAGVTLDAGLAVGIALALAAELHSFLEQRRCRALWAAYQRTSDLDTRERLASQLKAHSIILAALVLFSAVNATAFAAETWHPAPGFLPIWLQIGIRGAVVPVLFLLTGALSPLSISAGDELAATSRHMLRKTIRAVTRQWNGRIDRARRHGVDLAPVAIALMEDAGDSDGARRVQLIADGLERAEKPVTLAPVSEPTVTIEATPAPAQAQGHASDEPPTKPPTGPGTPRRAKRPAKRRASKRPAVLRLAPPETPEQRIRAVLNDAPDISIRQLAKRAEVSESTASKYARLVRAEAKRAAR